MSTGTDILTRAQRTLVDIEDDAYLNDGLTYINEARNRFAVETNCCQTAVDLTVTSRAVDFSTILAAIGSSDCKEVGFIVKIDFNQDDYDPIHKAPFSSIRPPLGTDETTPTRFSVFGEKIYFDVNPDATVDFDITVYCSYIPTDLETLDGDLVIPEKWADAIVHYVAYCCRLSDRDSGLANGEFNEYEAIREQAVLFYRNQIEGR